MIVDESLDVNKQQYDPITCSINQEYTVGCRKEGDDVFLPFSFIEKYFEVTLDRPTRVFAFTFKITVTTL